MTNKPEVVMTLLGGEQLVRLSDYEALQAECEQLVEALECALETMENVDGANDCSRGIDAVEEALAAHRIIYRQTS